MAEGEVLATEEAGTGEVREAGAMLLLLLLLWWCLQLVLRIT